MYIATNFPDMSNKHIGLAGLLIAFAVRLYAVPTLQLDIHEGEYDPVTETVIASGNPFTLIALYDISKGLPPDNYSFFISAAIIPKTNDPTSFGSFSIDPVGPAGMVSYGAGQSGALYYGTPPVDSLFPDIPTHGIFQTVYAEVGFTFNLSNRAKLYNTEDSPGGFKADQNGKMLYQEFVVDISDLAPGTVVHFDLYDEIVKAAKGKKSTTYTYDSNFAPFSHDTQSLPAQPPPCPVPEGGATLGLLALGAFIVGALRRALPESVTN